MGTSPKTAKILAVDDDQATLRLIRVVFERHGYRVTGSLLGRDGLALAAQEPPRAIILDLSLPDIPGLEVCRRLRDWFRGPILVLSGRGEEHIVVEALDLGADDYLKKPFRPLELVARLRALERRTSERTTSTAVIRSGELELNLAQRHVFKAGKRVLLTRTEFDILSLLALEQGRVVPWETLAERLWGDRGQDYTQTLRVHIGNIRKKIESKPSEPRYLRTVTGFGYILSDPEDSSNQAKTESNARE